jgi:hypothetical protein
MESSQPVAADGQRAEHRPGLRGRPFPPGVSGNPSGNQVGKRVTELYEGMLADFPEPSSFERTLISSAARMLARSERVHNHEDAVRCSNAAVRLLTSLRVARRKRGRPAGVPPLRERLAAEVAIE